jgi:hypothetical protein
MEACALIMAAALWSCRLEMERGVAILDPCIGSHRVRLGSKS